MSIRAALLLTAMLLTLPARGGEALQSALLLDLCQSNTMDQAQKLGDSLGWTAVSDEDMADWRAGMEAYPGGSVDVIGWRNGDETLHYWINSGPSAHRACYYMGADAFRFREAVEATFGSADTDQQDDLAHHAAWQRDGLDISITQTGPIGIFSIGNYRK